MRGGGEASVTRAMSRVGSSLVADGVRARAKRVRADTGVQQGGGSEAGSGQRRKTPRVPRALVRDLRVEARWHMQRLASEPGWRVWFQESADQWRAKYIIKHSKLMEQVTGATGHMWGLYAAH